jgi:RNA polymerase sigma-70 factor (ECF subfamily)
MMREEPPGTAEEALAEAWSRGEPEALRRVVQLHGPALLRVALALCPRPEDAEEVVQDSLLLALRSASAFDPRRGGLRSWLVGVAANRARQVRRGVSRYHGLLARLGREPYEPAAPADRNGDLSFARQRLALLPAREREAFVLLELEDLSSVEAARVMGISDSTVRVLASRARARLQNGAGVLHAASMRLEGRR